MAYDVLTTSCIEMYSGVFNPFNFNQCINRNAHNTLYVLSNPQFVFWGNHTLIKHLNLIERSELALVDSDRFVYMVSFVKMKLNEKKLSEAVIIK